MLGIPDNLLRKKKPSVNVQTNNVTATQGGGGGSWGSITGTLSNQTDLQTALDTKLESLTGDVTTTGSAATLVKASSNFAFTGVISYAPSGTVNNANPTGLSTASVILVNPQSDSTVFTGLAGGSTGRIIKIINVSGTYRLQLTHNDSGSTTTNRFFLPADKTIYIQPNETVELVYSTSTNRWYTTRLTPNYAYDDNGIISADFILHRLYSDGGVIALNLENGAILYDSSGAATIVANERIVKANDGTTSAIDWSNPIGLNIFGKIIRLNQEDAAGDTLGTPFVVAYGKGEDMSADVNLLDYQFPTSEGGAFELHAYVTVADGQVDLLDLNLAFHDGVQTQTVPIISAFDMSSTGNYTSVVFPFFSTTDSGQITLDTVTTTQAATYRVTWWLKRVSSHAP